jgi:hypothetical protein
MRKILSMLAAVVLLFSPIAHAAQLGSNTATVALSYNISESITVSGVPSTATFTGVTPTTPIIAVTTTWVLAATRTHLDTNLYFTTPTAALTDGAGHNIPTSSVFANLNGGAYSACTSSPAADVVGATVGGTCNVGFGVAITAANQNSSNTSNFTLQLQGLSASLPAGAYTGTLNIVAGAN